MLSGREGPLGVRHALPAQEQPTDGRVAEAYAGAVRQTLERLGRAPVRPRALLPFHDLFGGDWRAQEIERAGRPVVGYVCNFVPDELVLAAGAIPLRLDLGQAAAAEAGGQVLGVDVCPEVKALVGAELAGLPLFRRADLLVVPSACDGKKKLVRLLGERRAVHLLELPQSRDGRHARAAWREEIQALARRVEQLTGRSIRRRALREAIELVNRRSALTRRLNELRWARPGLISGRDALLVMQASFVADPAWWVDRASELVRELEQRAADAPPASEAPGAAAGGGPVRVLLAGSPVLFPDFQLLNLIEEEGRAVVVGDELCSGTQRLYHPTVVDEPTVSGMIRAAAEKTLLPCTCPCFVSSDLRLDRLLELVERSRAQGVIQHTLRLCQLFDLETPRVSAALKARDVPLLHVHAEYSTDGTATLKNRVEAFLEMLQP